MWNCVNRGKVNSDSVFTDSLLVKYLFKVSHAVTKAISIDGILYVYCWLGTGNFPQEGVQFTNSTDNAKNSHPTYSDFQATRLWDERILRNNFSCLEVIKWSERINTETVLIIFDNYFLYSRYSSPAYVER